MPNTVTVLSAHDVRNFAGWITSLASQTGKFGIFFGPDVHNPDHRVEVEIVASQSEGLSGPIWDSITIDGVSCGNRHGGIAEFSARFAAAYGLPGDAARGRYCAVRDSAARCWNVLDTHLARTEYRGHNAFWKADRHAEELNNPLKKKR